MIQVKKGNYNKLFKSYIFLMHILIHCFINKKNFERYLLLSSELIIFRLIYSVIFFFFLEIYWFVYQKTDDFILKEQSWSSQVHL